MGGVEGILRAERDLEGVVGEAQDPDVHAIVTEHRTRTVGQSQLERREGAGRAQEEVPAREDREARADVEPQSGVSRRSLEERQLEPDGGEEPGARRSDAVQDQTAAVLGRCTRDEIAAVRS